MSWHRPTGTTSIMTKHRHSVSGTVHIVPPLIRTPVVSMAASGFKGSHSQGNNSRMTFTKAPNEVKRREKLRAVLSMMGSTTSSKVKNRRQSKVTQSMYSIEEHSSETHQEDPTSLLTMANLDPSRLKRPRKLSRKMSVVSNSTQSSYRGRRGAILTGMLPVRSFPEGPSDEDLLRSRESNRAPKVKIKGGKFRVVSKLIVLLIRFCRTYILTENDAKMIRLFSAIDAAQAGDRYKIKSDLIFDVTQFKADKQSSEDDISDYQRRLFDLSYVFEYRISNDTKRILQKEPEKRTEKEISHVQVELQPLKFVKRYPVAMQRRMIEVGWYEEFTQGRVITRYGKRPSAFYLILGGSALVLEGNPEDSGRDATSAERGDIFGNEAIASRGTHKTSVISKEHIHLLCLSIEDYSRIFLAGGLQNFSDVDDGSFIRTIFLFDDWPVHLLKDSPKMVKFNYYTRGTVIVEDSDRSDWIYIIKSGSCSVMKVFHQEHERHAPTPAKKRRKATVQNYSHNISHELKLSQKLQELNRKRTKRMKGHWRQDLLKDNLLRIPQVKDPLQDSPDDQEISPDIKHLNVLASSTMYDVDEQKLSPRAEKGKMVDIVPPVTVMVTNDDAQTTSAPEGGGKLLPHQRIKFAKGPYLTHVKPSTQTQEEHQPNRKDKSQEETASSVKGLTIQVDNMNDSSSDEREEHQKEETLDKAEKSTKSRRKKTEKPMHIQIDTLEKGDIFGLLDVAFGKQLTKMSLVSNGVECIEISKKFYMKHANESIIQKMTEKLRPYATEETLTKDLKEKLTWNDHRESTMKDTARQFKRYKKLLSDPRLPRLSLLPDVYKDSG